MPDRKYPFREVGPLEEIGPETVQTLVARETAAGPGRPPRRRTIEKQHGRISIRGAAFERFRRPEWLAELAHADAATDEVVARLAERMRREPRGVALWEAEVVLNELARRDPEAVKRALKSFDLGALRPER